MTQTLVMPYEQIVQKLLKPDTIPMQILHCSIGVVGEVIELIEAKRSVANRESQRAYQLAVVEELGDSAFYLQACLNVTMPGETLLQYEYHERTLEWHFLEQAGELLDCGKRHVIYGKAFEAPRWEKALKASIACFFSELRMAGLSLIQVQLANQEKLLTGEKARYALGIYTDAQANARQDKA